MKRAVALALACLALLVAVPATAAADEAENGPMQRYIDLIEGIRGELGQTLELYAAGDVEGSFQSARSAYLDSFELVEIPLRDRDPNMTLEMEEAFARLRADIRAGRSADAITADVSRLQTGLNEVERTLSLAGYAPLVVAGTSFAIVARAGFETILLLSAVMAYLAASRAAGQRRYVFGGVVAAAAATIASWFAIDTVLAVAPFRPALVEAIPGVAAVLVTIAFSVWLVRRVDQRRWLEFASARIFAAVAFGSTAGLVGLGFATTFREGFEAVVSLRAVAPYARGLESWLLVGVLAAAGLVVLATVGLIRLGWRLQLRSLLLVAVVLTMAVSVVFVGNTVRALQEAYLVGITNLTSVVPRLPIHLAQATGFHPTLETIAAQLALILFYATWLPFMLRSLRAQPVAATVPA